MNSIYNKAADIIVNSGRCTVLTGAGISAESGIPTFRSKGGLWKDYDPTVYASLSTFQEDPSKYWSIRGDFIWNYGEYNPNEAHYSLARLEEMGIVSSIITQNIDGLHKKAGSKNVFEIHGSLREIYCQECNREYIAPEVPKSEIPTCSCGGVLKPNTVLFGEPLPEDALFNAQKESEQCGSMIVIGTSATVYPAAQLPLITAGNGGKIIEINIERSLSGADLFIDQKAGTALPLLEKEIIKLLDNDDFLKSRHPSTGSG